MFASPRPSWRPSVRKGRPSALPARRVRPVNQSSTMSEERCCSTAALRLSCADAAKTEIDTAPAGAHPPGLTAGPSVVMIVASARRAGHGAASPPGRLSPLPASDRPGGIFATAQPFPHCDRARHGPVHQMPLASVPGQGLQSGIRPRTIRPAHNGRAACSGKVVRGRVSGAGPAMATA